MIDEAADAVGGVAKPALPAHLLPLSPDSEWAIWRWSCLRSAGFPAATVSTLAAPDCAAAADRLNELSGHRDSLRESALGIVRASLDELRQTNRWDSPDKKLLTAAMSALQPNRKLPKAAPEPAAGAIDRLRRADADLATAQAAYNQSWQAAQPRTATAITELVRDARFSEAIVWQNREAFHSVITSLRRDDPSGTRNQTRRRREELVARYAQRYCVKNDSIGFFGPISWATFETDGPPIAVEYGTNLLRERRLYVEQWGIDALADVISALPGISPWCAPRRLPFAYFSDGTLHTPGAGTIALSPAQSALLAGCNGRRTAQQLASEIVAMGEPDLSNAEEVYAYLDQLRHQGLIVWTMEVPFTNQPDRALSTLIERIGDDSLRTTAERVLRVYRSAIVGVGEAAGDLDRLDTSIARLESVFTRITGKPAVRGHGKTYAARAVVYEHCLRDIDVQLGPELLSGLAGPLTLLLQSARWLTSVAAARARHLLHDLYRELREKHGTVAVRAADFWQGLPTMFPALGNDRHQAAPFITELRREFSERWQAVLGTPDLAARSVQRSATELRPRVAELFAASKPGWQLARHHSPDLFLAAADEAAVARGDYRIVLGEMHLANNTVAASVFADNHPHAEQLPGFMAADLPRPVVITAVPRHWRGMTSSTRNALLLPRDLHLLMSHEFVPDHDTPEANQLGIGELLIEEADGQLRARTYDRRYDEDIIELLGELMSVNVVDGFTLFAVGAHTPRITIDQLVVQREAWRVPLDDFAGLIEMAEAQRFAAFRGWASSLGIPDQVFLSVPMEDKPMFVDLTSPILVGVIVKALRRALERNVPGAAAVVGEMLPGLGDCWLGDRTGARYTSEFRTVMVDLAGR